MKIKSKYIEFLTFSLCVQNFGAPIDTRASDQSHGREEIVSVANYNGRIP